MIIQKWKNAKIRVQGIDHKENQKPCQDAVYTLKDNGVTAIALADGAGSRKNAEIGAQIATKKVCELLTQNFQHYLQISEQQSDPSLKKAYPSLRETLHDELYRAIADFAHNNTEIKVYDMASTLMFFAFRNGRYIMGHIGDGVIVGLQSGLRQDYLDVLSHPDNGDQPNVTFFLTEPDGKDHLRLSIGKVGSLKGILLMSDGPEEVFYDKHKGMHHNTLKVFQNFQNVIEEEYETVLKNLLDNNVAKYSFDDLSLNLLFLEEVSTQNLSKDYAETLFKDIISKRQIIRRSRMTVFVDDSVEYFPRDFNTTQALLDYLETL